MVNFQIWAFLCWVVVLACASDDVVPGIASDVVSQANEETENTDEPQPNSLPEIIFTHDKYHDHKPIIHKPKPKPYHHRPHKPQLHKPHIPVHHISIPIPHLPLPNLSHLFKPVLYHKPNHHVEYGPHHIHEYETHNKHTTCHCPPQPQCHHETHTTHRPQTTHRTTTKTPTTHTTKRTTDKEHHHETTKQPSHYHHLDSTIKPELFYHHTGSSGAYPRDTSLTTFIRQLFWPFNPYQQGSENERNLQFYNKSEKEYSSEDEEGNSIAAAKNLESQDPAEEVSR